MTKFTITSLFFILALILDFIVRNNYFSIGGVSIKNIYLKLINKSIFTIYLFTLNFVLLTLLGYFDISLFNLVESFKFERIIFLGVAYGGNGDINTKYSNNYIGNLFSNSNSDLLNNKFSDFPLNLLIEVNKLVDVELLFLIIIINIYCKIFAR